MTRALAPTLIQNQTLLKQAALVTGGAALTALAAQASIPMEPVPLTLQTLAVTLCGITLGARLGTLSMLTYLAAGACGLPVFAEGKAGFGWLFGFTGGYLWAFVLAAGLLGWLADRGWDRKILTSCVALGLANLLILALGTTWLSSFIGWPKAWAAGFVPFVSGAVIKSAVVILAMPLTWRLVGKDRA